MLKVRTGRSDPIGFTVALGQRNAHFVTRHRTPLHWVVPQTDAFTMVEPGYDLIHSVNAIPVSRLPFLVTFEDRLPCAPPTAHAPWFDKALTRLIAGKRCVALLATSEHAKRQMAWQHRLSPHRKTLLGKTEVLYPTVPSSTYRHKRLGASFRVLFVGNDVMRQCLPALIFAHEAVAEQGVPIETTIISSLRWRRRDYVGPPSKGPLDNILFKLGQPSIRLLDPMPDDMMLDMMRESDLLALPTLHDTFGYVLLHAMSRGTPVVATATCAIPEIVCDEQNGWLLPLPTDRLGRWEWLYHTKSADYIDAYNDHMRYLAGALVDVLLDLWEHRDGYEAISAAALETVSSRFNRDRARVRLETLYEQAVGLSDVR